MENQTHDEISLLELWHRIWKNKYIVIAITLLITILGTFALFFVNKSGAVITNKFIYNFVDMESETYSDGSLFDYRRFKSIDFLEQIIASDEKFSKLDVTKLADDEKGIQVDYVTVKSNNSDTILDYYLELEVPLPLFNNDKELAKSFVRKIHETVTNIALEKNRVYNLESYFYQYQDSVLLSNYESLTYFQIFDLLQDEYQLINNGFNTIKERHGSIMIDGVSIDKLQREFNTWYTQRALVNGLKSQMFENQYIKNYPASATYANLRITSIDRQITLNDETITSLTDIFNTLTENKQNVEANIIFDEISTRIIQNQSLKADRLIYQNILNQTEENIDPIFDAKVTEIKDTLYQYLTQYNQLYSGYLDENTRYIPHTKTEFTVDKPFNMILMVIVSGMIGGILGVSTALIKEAVINNTKKEEEIA